MRVCTVSVVEGAWGAVMCVYVRACVRVCVWAWGAVLCVCARV